MKKNIELYRLSKYRKELMGFSALLILVCHAYAYIDLPPLLGYVLSIGNIGVDCFLFLSGMGLWYSLSKFKSGGGKNWYINRYKKLFIPYLLTKLTMDLILFSMGKLKESEIMDYLWGLSSLRFYVSHDTFWFIAALIPLYLFAPTYFLLLRKYGYKVAFVLIFVHYLILLIPPSFQYNLLNNVIENILFVSVRATCFVLGMALGQSVMDKRHISLKCLFVMVVLGIIAIVMTRHLVYGWFFFTLPLLLSICYVMNKLPKVIISFVRLMGDISLESYILNATLPKLIILLFIAVCIPKAGNIIPYITACIVSIPIGYCIHSVSDKILKINSKV